AARCCGRLFDDGRPGAAAYWDNPSSDSMTNPIIGPAENQEGAAAVRQDTIFVTPNDGDYALVEPTTLSLPFHIEAEVTANKWRIKDSYITVGTAPLRSAGQVGVCCGSLGAFDPYNYARRVHHGSEKHVDMDGVWIVEVKDNSLANRARNACRRLRDD